MVKDRELFLPELAEGVREYLKSYGCRVCYATRTKEDPYESFVIDNGANLNFFTVKVCKHALNSFQIIVVSIKDKYTAICEPGIHRENAQRAIDRIVKFILKKH